MTATQSQPSLFDRVNSERRSTTRHPRAMSRRSDPSSSHEAAQHMFTSGKIDKYVSIIAKACYFHPGTTGRELAVFTKESDDLDYESLHKRLADAERRGLIYRGRQRVCSVTGRKATEWWPTEKCKAMFERSQA